MIKNIVATGFTETHGKGQNRKAAKIPDRGLLAGPATRRQVSAMADVTRRRRVPEDVVPGRDQPHRAPLCRGRGAPFRHGRLMPTFAAA